MNFASCPTFPKQVLDEIWGKIRHVSEALAKDNGYPISDLYNTLLYGTSHLFLGDEDGMLLGFVVLQFRPDSEVFLWQLGVLTDDPGKKEAFLTEGMTWLEKHLFNCGIKKMTFSSPRRGWNVVAERLGFAVKHVIYEKFIQNGVTHG